jgi:predicted nucleotidyltransferase
MRELGFPYPDNALLLFEGGSKLHGAKLEGTDDTDWYGLYVEPAEIALGLEESEHFVYTTGGRPGGNRPQDVDLTLYGLRKWARLACKGNPSVLHFFFAKPKFAHPMWSRLRERRSLFFARNHVEQFLGYAESQMKRLYNERSKDVNRPALEAAHGYDTKFAMHIIRLLGEAKEFVESGEITLPRPNAAELIQIRLGKYKLTELMDWAKQLQQEAMETKSRSTLPGKVDKKAVSRLISGVYQDFWRLGNIGSRRMAPPKSKKRRK